METTNSKRYTSIDQIISEVQSAGSRFFDKKEQAFWSSRILPSIYKGKYFITSERDRDSNFRLYTIRKYEGGSRIETVGGFLQHATKKEALKALFKICSQEAK